MRIIFETMWSKFTTPNLDDADVARIAGFLLSCEGITDRNIIPRDKKKLKLTIVDDASVTTEEDYTTEVIKEEAA